MKFPRLWLILAGVTASECSLGQELNLGDNPTFTHPVQAITVSKCLQPNTQYTASVPSQSGHTYTWSIVGGGSIVSGQGTSTVVFQSATYGTMLTLKVADSSTGCLLNSTEALEVNYIDVPTNNQFYNYVCAIARRAITVGCGSGFYCKDDSVTRASMSVFLGKSLHTATWVPSPCAHLFSDVDCSRSDAPWIEELYNEGVTAGCATNPLRFCPDDPITRAQLAVFLIKMSHQPTIAPPAACGCIYPDVPAGAFAANFIEQLNADNHVAPGTCGAGNFCPNDPAKRDQMAEFLALAFGLTVP
jgi:hypothetical protein